MMRKSQQSPYSHSTIPRPSQFASLESTPSSVDNEYYTSRCVPSIPVRFGAERIATDKNTLLQHGNIPHIRDLYKDRSDIDLGDGDGFSTQNFLLTSVSTSSQTAVPFETISLGSSPKSIDLCVSACKKSEVSSTNTTQEYKGLKEHNDD